jgi:hypothetical protein
MKGTYICFLFLFNILPMKAEDIFTITKELPEKELQVLLDLIQKHLKTLKPKTKREMPTDMEVNNYLLKKVFKVKTNL